MNLLNNPVRCLASLCAVLAFYAAGAAAQDAGLVTQLAGKATYAEAGNKPANATPLMKIHVGDRIALAAGASLKLVYFKSARAETWSGPAEGTVGEEQTEKSSGKISGIALPAPATTVSELNRIRDIGRIGAVAVRSLLPESDDIKQARERYDLWRAQTTPDDLLPDFYLYSVYKQHKRQAEMQALAANMQKRAPASDEARTLVRMSAQPMPK